MREQRTNRQHRDPSADCAEEESVQPRELLRARSLAFARGDAARLRDPGQAQAIADRGTEGPSSELPHQAEVQRAFGHHDIGGIRAHLGGEASAAATSLGAEAYATGDKVAFRGAPDLHTAAHEAAHVVQHRAGVQLLGGMGGGDAAAEAHADAVADRVVAGQSAEALLDQAPAASGVHRQEFEGPATEIPRIGLDKREVTFGTAKTGESLTEYVLVTNEGDAAISLEAPSIGGPFTATVAGPRVLDPGDVTTVMIVYKPTVAGQHRESLWLTVPGGAGVNAVVTGNATDPPRAQEEPPAGGQPMGPAPIGPHPLAPLPTWMDEGTTTDPSAPASPAPQPAEPPRIASMLTPYPDQLRFGAEVDKDVGSVITLWNDGVDTVTIDDVYVAGGDQAFTAQLLGGNDIAPGASGQVAIEYAPLYNTGAEATLYVLTSDGATLQVPLSGPVDASNANGPAGSIDIEPSEIEFEPTMVGQSTSKKVFLRNRGLTPLKVSEIKSFGSSDSAFSVSGSSAGLEIPPGRSEKVMLDFRPIAVGQFSDLRYVLDSGDRSYGSFSLKGEGVLKAEDEAAADLPPVAVCEPLDQRTVSARDAARTAVETYDRVSDIVTRNTHKELVNGWIEYLSLTSLDPTISRQTVPDASIFNAILSNAVGNTLADVVVKPTERIKGVARTLVNKFGAGAGIAEPGKVVALAAAPLGFVMGVLVETLAGMLFDALIGDDSVEKAVEEAYEQGQADGAKLTGDAILAKVNELNAAEEKADAARTRENRKLLAHILQSCSADELEQITADVSAKTPDPDDVGPDSSKMVTSLLTLWARDHATSTTGSSKGLDKQWDKVTEHLEEKDPSHFEKGKVKNQPDLFLAQCVHEWNAHGLDAPEELQAAVYEEMGVDDAALGDEGQAAALAERLQKRFNAREFVWGMDGVKSWDKLEKGLGWGGKASQGQEYVSCRPTMAVENGSCVVSQFNYRIARGVHDVQVYTKPGDTTYHSVSDRSKASGPPAHVESLQLYDYLAQLQVDGHTVTREADAVSNAALLAAFGEEVAIPSTTHADGRGDPVVVYRLHPATGMKVEPGQPVQTKGSLNMVRGGNTILIWDATAASAP